MSKYTCSLCNYSTEVKGNINKHIKNTMKCREAEINIELIEVECEICGKTFENDSYLKQHLKRCFEKKTVIVNNFENAEDFKRQILEMNELIIKLARDNEKLNHENKELNNKINNLSSRLEKIEKDKKNGYEELEEHEIGYSCDYVEKEEFIPTGKEMVDKIMGKDYSFQVLIKGSTDLKTGIAYYDYIKVGNTIYVYNKSDITRSDMRWAGHLKIINTTECREDAVGKKNGMCFCSEHIKLKT